MNILRAVFSFKGRLGRVDFGIMTLILLACVLVGEASALA